MWRGPSGPRRVPGTYVSLLKPGVTHVFSRAREVSAHFRGPDGPRHIYHSLFGGLVSRLKLTKQALARPEHDNPNAGKADRSAKQVKAIRPNPVDQRAPQKRKHYKHASVCGINSSEMSCLIGW